jgi:hypothetical protein
VRSGRSALHRPLGSTNGPSGWQGERRGGSAPQANPMRRRQAPTGGALQAFSGGTPARDTGRRPWEQGPQGRRARCRRIG